jgi:hypothetical protein
VRAWAMRQLCLEVLRMFPQQQPRRLWITKATTNQWPSNRATYSRTCSKGSFDNE